MTAALIFCMAALLCAPRQEEQALANPIARIRSRWSQLSRTHRELLVIAAALGFGLLVLPWVIWIAGQLVLGPYAHGGLWSYLGDFFVELGRGNAAFWIIVLGPCALYLLARLLWLGWRRQAG